MNKVMLPSKEFLQLLSDRSERVFLLLASIRTAQMRHQNDGFGSVVQGILKIDFIICEKLENWNKRDILSFIFFRKQK